MNITIDTKPIEIDLLSPYMQWLLYKAETNGKQDIQYSLRENQEKHPSRNAESMRVGLEYLQYLAAKENLMYDVYSKEECVEDSEKKEVKLFFLRSIQAKPNQPFIICIAGGGFERVCSMVESFPVAMQFNNMGYHVFVLNYRVMKRPVFPTVLEDLSSAIRYILKNESVFGLDNKNYILNGFSAGGMIADAFGTEIEGWKKYNLPVPAAIFSVYAPLVFLNELELKNKITEQYPPIYIIHAKDDETVSYQNAIELKEVCDKYKIPVELELPECGKHGWGDGRDTDAQGWPERAVAFWEKLQSQMKLKK